MGICNTFFMVLFLDILKKSLRNINIVKRTKLSSTVLNKVSDLIVKKMLLDLTNILKSTTKVPKNEIKKVLKIFSNLKIL